MRARRPRSQHDALALDHPGRPCRSPSSSCKSYPCYLALSQSSPSRRCRPHLHPSLSPQCSVRAMTSAWASGDRAMKYSEKPVIRTHRLRYSSGLL